MAASRTGTPSQVDASAGSGSTTVTVPAAANMIVAFFSHWDNDGGSTLSLTLNGSEFFIPQAQLAEGDTAGESGVGVFTLNAPSVGDQTFAWNWSAGGARAEGGEIVLVYVTGASNAVPVRGANVDAATAGNNCSVSITSETTDLVLAFAQSFTPTTPALDGTVFINNAALNSQIYDVSEVAAGSGTTNVTMTGEAYSAMAALSIEAGPAVSGTVTASINEGDIVTGGKTLIVTLANDTFVPASEVADISFVGNALGAGNTTTSFSITLPATQTDDLIILEFAHRGTGNGTIGGTYDGPALALKHSQLFATSAFSGKTYWTRATGDHTGQTITGSSLTNSCAAIITIYRGALASGDPLTAATIVGEQNASGNETQAQITTTVDKARVVIVVANSPDVTVTSQACTTPGTLPARAERLSTGGTDSSIAHASAERVTAGATGAFTWAQTNGIGGSWAYAIKPNVTSPFDDARQAFIDGFTAADIVGTGWDAEVRDKAAVTEVVRTSSTVVTWTIAAQSGYDITALETITGILPAAILTSDDLFSVAAPSFTISPSGGYTLQISTGAFVLTGSAAATRAARKMTAAQASFALSGIATGLKYGRKLGAATGVFSHIGNAAALRADRRLAAAVAAFVESGITTRLAAARNLAAVTGPFVLTGADANLIYGVGYTLVAETGVFALSGQDVALLATRGLTAEAGIFLLSGEDAALLSARRLAAEVGSFALTGVDAATRANRRLVAAVGAFIESGIDTRVAAARRLAAETGPFILTGVDADLVYDSGGPLNYTLVAETGVFVLTAQDARLLASRRMTVDPGVFLLSVEDAALLAARRLGITTGVFSLTGNAADLISTGAPGEVPLPVAGTGPKKGGRRGGLLHELRLLKEAEEIEKKNRAEKVRRGESVPPKTVNRAEIKARIRLQQRLEAEQKAREIAEEREDEEAVLRILMDFLGETYGR